MEATEMDVDQIEQTPEVESEETKRERLEREHYDEIKSLNREFVMAHQTWEILKDKTGAAKKTCDELGKRLSNLIARGPDLQQKLFDPTATADQVDDQVEQADDAWRSVNVLDALDLTNSQFEKLEGEGIHNMGQLEDFRASAGLHSIKGFGQKAVDKIEDQIIEWLTENRDRFGEAVEPDQDDDQVDDQDEDLDPEDEYDEGEDDETEDNDDADELLGEL